MLIDKQISLTLQEGERLSLLEAIVGYKAQLEECARQVPRHSMAETEITNLIKYYSLLETRLTNLV